MTFIHDHKFISFFLYFDFEVNFLFNSTPKTICFTSKYAQYVLNDYFIHKNHQFIPMSPKFTKKKKQTKKHLNWILSVVLMINLVSGVRWYNLYIFKQNCKIFYLRHIRCGLKKNTKYQWMTWQKLNFIRQ